MHESTFSQLYKSAVIAFPNTKKRQYATDTVDVTHLEWIPYLGMRTLFLRAHVENSEGGNYDPILLFKNIKYHSTHQKGLIEIVSADTRQKYFLEPLKNNDILLRCSCKDFYWRFTHYNSVDKSLYGKTRSPYQGEYPINPQEMPGMCKHIMATGISLGTSGLMAEFRR